MLLSACSGGGNSLVAEARDRSGKTCSCEGFDCTMEHIAWFNEQLVINGADLDALDEADAAAYEAAGAAASPCQDALR